MTKWTALALGLAALAGLIAWLARHDYRPYLQRLRDKGAL